MQFNSLEDIQSLIQNRIEESITLEYKKELDNKEIAKDVSAFANTEGGTIIYGVQSRDKVPTGINWLAGRGVEERIQNVVMTTIHPRLEGIQVIRLPNPINDSEALFVVSIPKSPQAPHMAFNRYYSRRGSVSSPMEDAEIKGAIFGAGRTKALLNEISKNSELADRTHKLLEQIYALLPDRRAPIALIPFHTDAWNAVIASGLLYSLEGTVAERLVEAYRLVHEVNSLIAWLNMNNPNVACTPVEPSSAKHGVYLPAVLINNLPRLSSLLKDLAGQLPS